MNSPVSQPKRPADGYAYHLLRAALNSYQRNLAQLRPGELDKVRRLADKSFEIEALVLGSAEARDVHVLPEQVEAAFGEVAARYRDADELNDDLQRNGPDEASMHAALRRELLFDSVMQRVGARRVDVNEIDIRLFYELHGERFAVPGKRIARHILVTVDPDYPENTPQDALARIREVAARLKTRTHRFASLARRYSECPTATEGGKLGVIVGGQLYPELDAALFGLAEGALSDILEARSGSTPCGASASSPGAGCRGPRRATASESCWNNASGAIARRPGWASYAGRRTHGKSPDERPQGAVRLLRRGAGAGPSPDRWRQRLRL